MPNDDTDPTTAEGSFVKTDPGSVGPDVTDTEGSREEAAASVSPPPQDADLVDAILQGVRRERPPPKLTPIVRAASAGGVAEAYAAEVRELKPPHPTPPPEAAVEVRRSSPPQTSPEASERNATTVLLGRPGMRPVVLASIAGGVVVAALLAIAVAGRGSGSQTPEIPAAPSVPIVTLGPPSSAKTSPEPPAPSAAAPPTSRAPASTAPPPALSPRRFVPAPRLPSSSAIPSAQAPPPPAPINSGFERNF